MFYERIFYVTTSKFGYWLSQQLEKRGWSQTEFAPRVNVTRSHISSIITGRRGPSNDLLISIARVFRLPEDEVYQAAGLMPSKKSNHQEILVNRILSLSQEDQEIVEAFIDTMLERSEKKAMREDKRTAGI